MSYFQNYNQQPYCGYGQNMAVNQINPYVNLSQNASQFNNNCQPTTQQINTQFIYGKFIDCYETAKSQEIPFGTTGIYPQVDGSNIYVKSWNPDGSTKIITYKPFINDEITDTVGIKPETQILDAIAKLDAKLDSLKSTPIKNQGGNK